jgi:hypothetical protein
MRLIVDMRHVNELIDVPTFVFKGLHNLTELESKGYHMISFDLTSRFSHIMYVCNFTRLQDSLLGSTSGKFYIHKVLPFGLRSAPYALPKIVYVIVARWRRVGIIVLSYLDDFMFHHHMEADAIRLVPVMEAKLRIAGFYANSEKARPIRLAIFTSDSWLA